jgi:hypothetical protein
LQIHLAIPDIHAVIDRAVAAAATQELSARLQEEESATQEQNEAGSATPALAATMADLVVIDGV